METGLGNSEVVSSTNPDKPSASIESPENQPFLAALDVPEARETEATCGTGGRSDLTSWRYRNLDRVANWDVVRM